MNRFCCKFCGMITDNPEIVPHPDKDKEFRVILDNMEAHADRIANFFTGHWQEAWFETQASILKFKYNHSITCPVCGKTTCFWRDEPFHADEPSAKLEHCPNCGTSIWYPKENTPICQKCGSPILLTQHVAGLSVGCGCARTELDFPPDNRWAKPTDKLDDSTLRITLTPATRFGEMLGAEIDKAEKLGMNVKGIQLPYLTEFNGIPIRYY